VDESALYPPLQIFNELADIVEITGIPAASLISFGNQMAMN
jgi:hypothetical protein